MTIIMTSLHVGDNNHLQEYSGVSNFTLQDISPNSHKFAVLHTFEYQDMFIASVLWGLKFNWTRIIRKASLKGDIVHTFFSVVLSSGMKNMWPYS